MNIYIYFNIPKYQESFFMRTSFLGTPIRMANKGNFGGEAAKSCVTLPGQDDGIANGNLSSQVDWLNENVDTYKAQQRQVSVEDGVDLERTHKPKTRIRRYVVDSKQRSIYTVYIHYDCLLPNCIARPPRSSDVNISL